MTAPINADRNSLIVRTGASLALVAMVVGFALFGGGAVPDTLTGRALLAVVACLAPWLVLLLLLARRATPSTLTLGLTSALGLGVSWSLIILAVAGTIGRAIVILTMALLPVFAGLVMGSVQVAEWVSRLHPIALVMLIVLAVVQFQVAKLARQARPTVKGGTSDHWTAGRVIGFAMLGAVAFVAVSARSHAETASVHAFIKEQEQKRAAGVDSYHAMVRLQVCATTYADSVSKGEFPSTLAAMGPAGSKCLDSATATGMISGYLLQYHPVADSSGRTVRWWAIAQRPKPQPDDNALVADHTGALYLRRFASYQRPNSNNIDSTEVLSLPAYSDLGNWVLGAKCIRDAYARDQNGAGYPSDLTSTERMCLHIDRNRIVVGDYVLTYEAERPDRSGRYRNFVLHATALHYGRDVVRSYLIEPDGVVHVTASPRAAATSDPVYVGCEIESAMPCRIEDKL